MTASAPNIPQNDDAYALCGAGLRHHRELHISPRILLRSHLVSQISLHYILSFSHEGYGQATSFKNIAGQLHIGEQANAVPPYKTPVPDEYIHPQKQIDPLTRKANATFVILARNGDLQGVITSMKQAEDRFNKEFQYPYVFLNEEPFSEEFKRCVYLTIINTASM